MKNTLLKVPVLCLALTCATVLAQAVTPRQQPSLNGRVQNSFAFHYQPTLTEQALAWYSQFELLITHDPLPREQVERLQAAGTRVLLYEWAGAFYESRATEWQRSLLSSGGADLLNAEPLTGSAGSSTSGAWYFDPSSHAHEFDRAADLARRIENAGYDGVFFDVTTVDGVHPQARSEYERRHPGVPYDLAFSRFLAQLRRNLPNGILFSNQGYRRAPYYLPYVDWDLTESVITAPVPSIDGLHEVRPWMDTGDPWNSIHFVMKNLIEPVAARYPHVRFAHLNYAHERKDETIQLVVAVAELFASKGYVAAPAVNDEVHGIYLRNGGQPVAARIDLADGMASYRIFENGIVAVTSSSEEVHIPNPGRKAIRNHLTGQLVCSDTIPLPAATIAAPRAYFFDFDHSSSCR